jgi:hypothetical protein
VLVRPYNLSKFSLDVDQGDIFTESGDILVVGRPRGIHSPLHDLNGEHWETISFGTHIPSLFRLKQHDLPWKDVYSIRLHRRNNDRLPLNGNDIGALRYYWQRNYLEFLIFEAIRRTRSGGHITLGMTPLSWRSPIVVSHMMAEALAGVFYCLRNCDSYESLKVIIRSTEIPEELFAVLDRDYFKNFRHKQSWFSPMCDVWCDP